jgi:hypothetical protein
MKHLRKFFESIEDNTSTIKQYFYDIIDDLDGICNFDIKANTSNYFTITISLLETRSVSITNENPNLIDKWIEKNQNMYKILTELKTVCLRLQDENILESFKLMESSSGYYMNIYTKLEDTNESNQWIFVEEDYSAWLDELRLRKYVKDKFGATVEYAGLSRRGDNYIELVLNFETAQSVATLNDIIKDFTSIKTELDGEEVQIFDEGYFFSLGKHLYFSLDYIISDYQ